MIGRMGESGRNRNWNPRYRSEEEGASPGSSESDWFLAPGKKDKKKVVEITKLTLITNFGL